MEEKVENYEKCDYTDVVVPTHGGVGLLLKSPNERAQLWARVGKARDQEERELLVRAVASDLLEDLRSEFDLYSSYEDPFVDTVLLLDHCGRLVEPEMLDHYKDLGGEKEDAGRNFFYAVIDRLAEIAGNRGNDPEARQHAADRYLLWREHVGPAEEDWLTVAEVAKQYDVVVQTVYKWIAQGKLKARKTPGGGGTRVSAKELKSGRVHSELIRLAANTVGAVRRIDNGSFPAFEKALAAIERGDIPPLPRRRYLPDRAAALRREDLTPRPEHVEQFRETKKATGRRRPFRGQDQ